MLDYEKQIFLDILQEDGLVVAAKGLGLDSVIVNLLKVYCDPGNLVFVLGAEDHYQEWLVERLISGGASPPPRIVNSEVGGSEREKSYLEGGLWFVPSTILIVDLIKKRVPIDLITGIVVCKAHNILKNHKDSFVVRLYRQGNKTGFIKAFSNQASSLRSGFSKAEQVLKALFLRNLFLWPRYHASIKSTLNECKPLVVELHLEMTGSMLQLQNSLLDLIKTTVQELKRLNPLLDTDEVTVENVINSSFHKLVHSQMDPVWHALSDRTKTILADLKLFHHMTTALLTLDSISFYSLVNSQRKLDRAVKGSGWHLLPSAEILFTVSRQRVFGSKNINVVDVDEVDAEPNPKWLALSQILNEIHKTPKPKSNDSVSDKVEPASDTTDAENSQSSTDGFQGNPDNEGDILILVRDDRTCSQLRGYLTQGSNEYLKTQYRKFFFNKTANDKPQESNIDAKSTEEQQTTTVDEENEIENVEVCKISLQREVFSQLEGNKEVNLAGFFEETFSQSQKMDSQKFTQKSSQDLEDQWAPIIVIKSYKKNIMYISQVLQEMKPNWVILYDSDMTLVRQLEVFQRKNTAIPLTVYFLVYGGTIEEQAYLTSLRKEKEAFDYLIQEKARMVIPEDRSDCPELTRDASKASDVQARTRKGGLDTSNKQPSKIIVDMREFRSELPALIHARGIDIEPVLIPIGDYILTPEICLERKSVSDLIQSLNSGRLYNQATAMTRHYARPMLLIEFDKDRPFDLQNRHYVSNEAATNTLLSKLQLLTLHFPKLRIIWSPSPHATAELFEELKQGHPEPDAAVAACLGVEQDANDEDTFNPAVQNFLLKLPGVTSKNIYALLRQGKSLDHLKSLSKEEISAMVENSIEGEIIYNAFHKCYQPESQEIKTKSFPGSFRGKRKRFH
ncbi:UNVERIFIED_CONTAM: hypothetical protein PYX00_003883 [Menopon gallinae]|uniref:DNA repair endonuclease XPF n=1 Tax=Menopon gallinae TaxID=328185 RepID=A0AAW2I1P3_9NEOP